MMKEINDKDKYIDNFSRLFVLTIENKIHFQVITNVLANSSLVKAIEANNYSELVNNSPSQLFTHYFNIPIFNDDSLYNYNDAYWCGYIYLNLFYKYHKPLSYIFLKLPLSKLIDMYPVYHEMDISNVYKLFEEIINKETILSLLLKKHSMLLTELSTQTNISISILRKYKISDSHLYKGSFNNIHKIALALDEPDNLFLEQV